MKKQPEATERTRQKLINAFWTILEKKSLNQVTVREISGLAGCNRSTFYEYFTDIPDLLRFEEDKLLDEVKTFVPDINGDSVLNADTFQIIFKLLNRKAYYLLGVNGDPSFFPRLKSEIINMLKAKSGIASDFPNLDYIIAYAYSALLGYLQHWHEQDRSLSEEEVFQLGHDLITNGVIGVLMRELKEPRQNTPAT